MRGIKDLVKEAEKEAEKEIKKIKEMEVKTKNMNVKELLVGMFAVGFPLYRFVLEDGSVMVSRGLAAIPYLAERGIEVLSWGVY